MLGRSWALSILAAMVGWYLKLQRQSQPWDSLTSDVLLFGIIIISFFKPSTTYSQKHPDGWVYPLMAQRVLLELKAFKPSVELKVFDSIVRMVLCFKLFLKSFVQYYVPVVKTSKIMKKLPRKNLLPTLVFHVPTSQAPMARWPLFLVFHLPLQRFWK